MRRVGGLGKGGSMREGGCCHCQLYIYAYTERFFFIMRTKRESKGKTNCVLKLKVCFMTPVFTPNPRTIKLWPCFQIHRYIYIDGYKDGGAIVKYYSNKKTASSRRKTQQKKIIFLHSWTQ